MEPPRAGVFLWIELPDAPFSGIEIARRCLALYGINLMPGDVFGARRPSVRAGFALPEDKAARAFGKLGIALRDMGVAPATGCASA